MNRRQSALLILRNMALAVTGGCLSVQLPQSPIHPGQSQTPLGWERTVETALERHPDLLRARAELEAQRHNRNAAVGAFLPSADGTFSRTRSRSSSTAPTDDDMAFELAAEQVLFNGFGTTADFIEAWRDWQAARWAYRKTSADVRLRLRTAFVELMRLADLLEAHQRIAKRRADNAEMIQLRYEAGREHKGSLLRAQANAQQAEFRVRQTTRRIEQRTLSLGREMGGEFWMSLAPEGRLEAMIPPPVPKPADYAQVAEQLPNVQRLIKAAESTKAAVVSAQSDLWPQVTGSYQYGYSGARASHLRDDASLSLKVSLPLFNGGQNLAGIFEANAAYEAALQTARSARDQAIVDLSQAWTALQDALETVTVRRAFLEAARERAEIVRSQYTSGLADFQDFDIAEQELADSESAYVESLADALIAQATWDNVLGLTLEDALNG